MKTGKLILLVAVFFVVQSCKKSSENFDSDYFLFRDYITSFSSGVVSANADVQVGLTFGKKEWLPNQEIDSNIFSISPSVDGKVIVLPNNILVFRPSKKLEQDKEYQITLHLSKIVEVPEKLADFKFTIKTIKQDFVVDIIDLQSYNKDLQFLNMMLKSADNMDLPTAKKLVTAEQNGIQLPIKFNENPAAAQFPFVIDKIQRMVQDSKVIIHWNGNDSGIQQKGSMEFLIPGKDNFKIVDVAIGDEDNQSLLINFSDPVKKDQNFSGLVALENAGNLQYTVDGNVLKVFFESPLEGKLLLEVFQGIESIDGYKMKKPYAAQVTFEQMKPAVQFVKSGTILPSSNNLKVNFRAVNLKMVDVRVYRIFQNNVLQFLQDNEIDGSYNLRKVALPIAKKTLDLTTNKMGNYKKWNSYSLDLSTLIKPEQGAIYRVEFTIKKAYSLYTCDASEADAEEEKQDEDEEPEDFSEWADNDYYDYDYDWNERENPCNRSYYSNNKIAINILATDLGVIVKRGENNTYLFAVNNIVTTDPVSGATVEMYNYQKQKVGSFTTGSEGTISFTLDKKAYFAVVKKNGNTTYLKLEDGNSQSVSSFDVDGVAMQKGLKGYIYGERGVWRPGDTLYISFILNDKASKLPATHPIKLKLADPSGKVVYQSVQKYSDKNHYKFVFKTHPNSKTGNYEAVVSVGGARFYKSIKIETIKPNRLKIKNGFNGKLISAARKNDANVEVMWLHGAVAKNLKVEMQAKFSQQKTAFKAYPKFIFDDPARDFSTEEINVFSGKVDESGKAVVSIQPRLQSQAPGMLKAAFITKAYENGGDVSTDVVTANYSPYQTYVGIKTPEPNKYGMLETGQNNNFDVVTVDENGRAKAVQNLEVRIYKVEWRWWWDEGNDDLSSYSASTTNTPYNSQIVSTDASGKARFQFKADENDWGRYLVRVTDPTGGHSAGGTVMIDWPSWSGKTRNTSGTDAKMLVFTSDKKNYSVGEKATISFPSSAGSRALISLENGSQVVQVLWAKTTKGETQVQIPITAKMAPNVYIHITLLQPHASTANDSPIRLYGIIPIEVIDKNTVLQPELTMPEVLKPEQRTTIKVSEKTGKAMTYTIAVVDEGLLDLTRFKTPNAWENFYTREALGVKTWDMYDQVIGAYGGKVNQIFSIGGDADLGGGKAKKANRFKPVVIYLGPFSLPAGQTKSHVVTLPKYIGSVRTMVVAANADASAYGSVEKATPVRSPLMILASLPRKVSPGEKVTLPVTVFAMENNIKNVTLQLKTNNGFRVISSSKQAMSFAQPDENIAYFDLEAADLTGIGKVTVVATSGKERASFDVELDIINPNPITQEYKELILEPNASGTINWNAFGVTGTNKAKLEISAFPSIDFNRRLEYLIQYPHGCVEQTTSGVFPQLYLADIADIDAARKQRIQKNVNAGIQRLGQFQQASGGFSYWPGDQYADDWGTSYAGHFFIEAEKKGYALPINAKKQWIAYQLKTAKNWRYAEGYHGEFAQAYRLYTLALAGSPDLSSMNRLRETPGISNESKLRLAAAYALAGQKNVGLALLNQSQIDEQADRYDYYYGSADRNRAMALETLLLLGRKSEAFQMANKIAKAMSSYQWMSTQTTAYCLYAMSKFAQQNGTSGIDVAFTSRGKSEAVKTVKTFADRTLVVNNGGNSVSIRNNKKTTLFVKVISSGILPIGKEQTEQRGLGTSIVFKDRKGVPINIASLAQGTEFVAEVTVRNNKNEMVENVALTQIIPSGWEIVNTRFTEAGDFADNKVDYTDIRDDRTNFYFTLKAAEVKTFRILLNASYLGKYYLPGVQCEAMYDNTFFARTKGQWVNVVRN